MIRFLQKSVFWIVLFIVFLGLTGCRGDGPTVTPSPTSISVSPTPTLETEKDIIWLTSIDDARKEALESNRLLLINFYTTWGGYSIRMEKETYSYYKVIDLSKNFVCVQVDLDENPDLEESYSILGNPTVVFEDPITGNEVKRIEGMRDRHEMTEEMEEMISYEAKAESGGQNE